MYKNFPGFAMQNWLPLKTSVMSTSPGLGLCGVLTAIAFGLRYWMSRSRECM